MSKGRKIILIILIVVLVCSLAGLGYQLYQSWERQQSNEDARDLANVPGKDSGAVSSDESGKSDGTGDVDPGDSGSTGTGKDDVYDPYAYDMLTVNLDALQKVNSDVIAWIEIPDTPISYPVVQTTDNEYYLKHSWKKYINSGGAIFMEWMNSADFSDFNTLIYGHRMSDGSMFNSLRRYSKYSYWQENPYVYVVTEEGTRVYEIFSACKVSVTDPVYWLVNSDAPDTYRQQFIDFCVANSAINTGITPGTDTQILTLSTCVSTNSSNYRWVVVAALKEIVDRDQ